MQVVTTPPRTDLVLTSRAGKRELLARGLFWAGVPRLARLLPQRSSLVVLNYHRIGNAAEDEYDPGIFSASAQALDQQLGVLKRYAEVVGLEEAIEFAEGTLKDRKPRCRVLITFDDGYRDNFETAFPLLRAHGLPATFFLATSLVGTNCVPWWDRAAYVLRTARRRRFLLHYPKRLGVDLDQQGFEVALKAVLQLFKQPGNIDHSRFFLELREAARGDSPAPVMRRFLDWEEAHELLRRGMSIGSHTHTHPIVSRLSPEAQREELAVSRDLLASRLGVRPLALAYPFGSLSMSPQAASLARELGYRAAFCFDHRPNHPRLINPFAIDRIGIGGQSIERFQVRLALCGLTASFWP